MRLQTALYETNRENMNSSLNTLYAHLELMVIVLVWKYIKPGIDLGDMTFLFEFSNYNLF